MIIGQRAEKTPAELIDRTNNYWRLWVTKSLPDFADLPHKVVELYQHSLLILRTLTDNHGGIIAANDSDLLQFGRDTYSYIWPRDAARGVYALIRAGYIDMPRNFFRFCADVITDEGYLLHKYNPDGSLGSSWHPWYAREQMEIPIQEDSTLRIYQGRRLRSSGVWICVRSVIPPRQVPAYTFLRSVYRQPL